jgi:hypothetical protein
MSLMIWDLDRSVMTNRVGNKPFAAVINDRLVVYPPPVDPTQAVIPNRSPEIFSYLYRLWLYQDGRPWRLKQYLRGADEKRRIKIEVNSKLLGEILAELDLRKIDYVFLIYYPLSSLKDDNDWRDGFLLQWMENNKVPYISSKVIVKNDAMLRNRQFPEYYIPNDGHPSTYQVSILSEELKRVILSRRPNAMVQH